MSEPDLVAKFRSLAEERLRRMNQGLLDLEQGSAAPAVLDAVMRDIHTLKGESRMLGLLAANVVAHRTEDLLQHARRTNAFQDTKLVETAYAGLDLLALFLGEPEPVISAPDEPRARAFEARVAAALSERGAAPVSKATPPTAAAPTAPGMPATPGASVPPVPEGHAPRDSESVGVVRVSGTTVDDLTRTTGVLGRLLVRIDRGVRETRVLAERAQEEIRALGDRGAGGAEGSARATERLRELADALDAEVLGLREACFAASLRHQRLRDTVSSLRLAEAHVLFGRFPRTVRELARELGKEAHVDIRGGHVGADQQVLEALADPLVHTVRNAIDHGLEPPEVRAALGKPRRGTITLEARQAGSFIEIICRDDGRGIDPKAVAEAAVRSGLLSEGDVARMTTEDLYDQLFRPAFSTKGEVTDVSGRGVGLDVVKRVVEGLGGSVKVQSEIGSGTAFVLRVPVSSALVDALVVQAGPGIFAVPALYVDRVLVAAPADLEPTGAATSVRLADGERAIVVDLSSFLPPVALAAAPAPRQGPGQGPADERIRLVVVTEGGRRLALRVDAFLGEMLLVQEALDPFLKGLRSLTGTATLEGGRLAVVLNIARLFQWVREERLDVEEQPAPARVAAPVVRSVLAVDDSDLTRSLVASTLQRAGLRVREAVDGRAALECLAEERPDVLVTDLEMPGMDGLELIRRVRADGALKGLPILVFTTRAQADSKQAAASAGADLYLVKSEFEEEALLTAVRRLLPAAAGTGA